MGSLMKFKVGRSPVMMGQIIAVLGGIFSSLLMPQIAQANDSSPLCSDRQMTNQVALSTPEYFAAICSRGYEDEATGCYVPTEYYYVGQSRKTGESLTVVRGIIEVSSQEPLTVYKATEDIYTYQIATSGSKTSQPWTSISIFENGQRIYHDKVNHYFGYRYCQSWSQNYESLTLPQPLNFSSLDLKPMPVPPEESLMVPSFSWLQEEVSLGSILTQKFDEEIDRYDQQIRANPESIAAYYDRGNRNYELKRYQQAIADYSEIITLNPDHMVAYFNRGVSQYRLENYDGAVSDFGQAIKMVTDSSFAVPLLVQFHNNLGVAYESVFISENAIEQFTQAIKLDPQYPLAYFNRGTLQHQWHNYDEAIADYTKTIELNSFFAMAYLYRGRAYYEHNATEDRAVTGIDPITGEFIDNTENYQKAIADYNAAIDLDAENATAYFQRGIVHHRLKNYDQAIADYSQAIALDDDYIDAYNNRGIAYAEGKQDHGQAIFNFYKTTNKNPQYAAGYYNLALAYTVLEPENTALTLGHLEKAIALDLQYKSDAYSNLNQQHYSFQDHRKLTSILTEILTPSTQLP